MPIGIDLKPVSKYSKLPSAKECPGCRCYVLSEQTEYISIASAWVINKGHGSNASTVIYVDSNRTDDYVATGSESSPYKTLAQYAEVELVFTSQATAYLTGDRAAS